MTHDVYGICITKNEADIIAFCLSHASGFCKKIFVLDNGSTDVTWDIVRALGEENDSIVPFERKTCRYGVGLRGYIFNRVRDQFKTGDWILILDSDEFMEEDPASRIAYCEKRGFDLIFALQAQFYITIRDVNQAWFKDAPTPIHSFKTLPRYYLINWREPRLFRYRNDLVWPDMDDRMNPTQISYPEGLRRRLNRGVVNRHYQYRSLAQMKERIAIRSDVHQKTGRFKHSREKDYRRYVRNYKRLKKSADGEIIRPTLKDLWRIYLIRRSKKFKQYFHDGLLESNY